MAKKRQLANVAPIEEGKKSSRWQEWILLVFLSLFSSFFLTYGFYESGPKLSGDILNSFSIFRNHLHSLNRFGETMWWNPTAGSGLGFPIYYQKMLGWCFSTPLFIALSSVVWLIGRMGIIIKSYQPLYVFYFGYAIPFMFNLGMYLVARQMFMRRSSIIMVMILSAFSPSIMFNLTDAMGEQTSYGLFFMAAWLSFLKKKDRRSLGIVYFTGLMLTLAVNHLFLYWNILFVPLMVLVTVFVGRESLKTVWNAVRRNASYPMMIAAVALVVFCVLPIGVTFSHGENLLRWHLGERAYSYMDLQRGNPLPFLTISTPGVAYSWSWNPACLTMYPFSDNVFEKVGKYAYLGLMALPLVVFGLVAGRNPWRLRLLILVAATAIVGILSGYSPIFSTLLVLPTPLRAVNHYSDTLFYNGGSILVILLAALGLDLLSRLKGKMRRAFALTWVLTTLISVGLFVWAYRDTAPRQYDFGFMLAVILLSLGPVIWLARAKSVRSAKVAIAVLIALVFVDTATIAYWHSRGVTWKTAKAINEPPATSIGIAPDNPVALYENFLLYMRETRECTVNPATLPALQLTPSGGSAQVTGQTYNRLDLKVSSPMPARLFWRDAWFQFWTATVDGRRVPIDKAYNSFKEIAVPAGTSNVSFVFSPGPVPYLLFLAHAAVFCVAIALVVGHFRRRRPAVQ